MRVPMRARASRLFIALLLLPAWQGVAVRSASGSGLQDRGKALFSERCASCHSIGGGRLVGPDLKGVGERRPEGWLRRFIREPDKLLASQDPIASELLKEFNDVPMPNMGVSEAEVDALLAYLGGTGESGAGEAPEPGQAGGAAAGPPAGDADAGQALFTGSLSFTNGGAPCMACHSVAGLGAFGGGTLGPDLTAAYTRFGQDGLASALQGLPFPSMREVFNNRPLTERERADLLAFFAQAATRGEVGSAVGFFLAGLGGFALLAALPPLVWRHRFRGVRQELTGGWQ